MRSLNPRANSANSSFTGAITTALPSVRELSFLLVAVWAPVPEQAPG
ncbi:TPA: hypothetical protein NBQ50_001913 [Corynebacterium striatum]|nr:hypothetical protein [Corynebacterium striatum]MDK8826435.1 hypothetical protein [Corynebacterium striatum]HCD1552289.1 hypothetical protein [Corynebacterium striatum]HCD2181680.1 hypothetical protein [Corynebacterium striatum]HCD3731375.1 hypothetical protein [Corynebacterium striatum]HCD4026668.1 hypothetical protein [Corynebacterium striatum]